MAKALVTFIVFALLSSFSFAGGHSAGKRAWVNGDYKLAIKLLQKSADSDPKAELILFFVKNAIPVFKTSEKAKTLKYYTAAAESESEYAAYLLGNIYAGSSSYGSSEQDYKKAIKWYKKSIELNPKFVKPYMKLATMYAGGYGVSKNDSTALNFAKKDKRSYESIEETLANNFLQGYITGKKDYKKAKYWLNKAIKNNNLGSEKLNEINRDIAKIYFEQGSTDKGLKLLLQQYSDISELCQSTSFNASPFFSNAVKSFELAERCAFIGDSSAQHEVANMYSKGSNVEKNQKQAMKWYKKSADQGNSESYYNLAFGYLLGKGVLVDYKKSMHWLIKSTGTTLYKNRDNDTSSVNKVFRPEHNNRIDSAIGSLYYFGAGVLQDNRKAIKWHTKAANRGYVISQLKLVDIYTEEPVKNLSKAKFWVEKIYENGNPEDVKKSEEIWNKFELWKY
jgi:TPR repeat protein